MKLYIVIHPDVPRHMQAVIAAHASLGSYLYAQQDPNLKPIYDEWVQFSFKKFVGVADNDKHFQKCLVEGSHKFTESSLPDIPIVAMDYLDKQKPVYNSFKFLKGVI